jgi:hypothetical protein
MATPTEAAVYVYGILPGDVALEEPTTGVGDPPMPVRLVRYRDIAALISDVDVTRPLGTPEDLLVHEALLDASAADAPVLPMRFGSLVANEDIVTSELLAPHYDEFAAALQRLEGYAEYIIRGRYVQDAIVREILAEDPEAAALTAQALAEGEGLGEEQIALRDRQVLLGEVIGERLSDKRAQDTRRLGEELAGWMSASVVRPPADEFEAVHTAFLIKADASDRLLDAVQRLSADWDGRVELRVLGPVAAYDFVGTTGPAAAG